MQDTWIRISDDTVFGYIIVPVCDTMVARQTAARERERERERERARERERVYQHGLHKLMHI